MDRLTGKASNITVAGTQIAITKATQEVEVADADTTDNGDYNPSQDMLNPTQLKVSNPVVFSIEGNYRKSQAPALSQAVFNSNPGGVPVELMADASTVIGHGMFDITNFTTEVPVKDTVTYTAKMKSNGVFTPNA